MSDSHSSDEKDGDQTPALERADAPSLTLSALLALAIGYTLYFAKPILLPVALALLLTMLLRPVVGRLHKWRIPWGVSAAIVLIAMLALFAGAVATLAQPASDWLESLPEDLRKAEEKLHDIRAPIAEFAEATRRLEEMVQMPADEERVGVSVESTTFVGALVRGTGGVLTTILLTIVFLYFMLASGDMFLRKLVHVLPRFRDKVRAVEIVNRIQADVSNYLVSISLINAVLGVGVGFAMWLVGMPDPALWGILAGLLNFIPYLGSFAGILLATMVAMVTLENIGSILLVPIAYYALTALEGNFVTPMVLGRRLLLNPLIVFFGLIFWGWIWGLPGAFLAVPILAVMKIIFDRVEPMRPLGEFMGGESPPKPKAPQAEAPPG